MCVIMSQEYGARSTFRHTQMKEIEHDCCECDDARSLDIQVDQSASYSCRSTCTCMPVGTSRSRSTRFMNELSFWGEDKYTGIQRYGRPAISLTFASMHHALPHHAASDLLVRDYRYYTHVD